MPLAERIRRDADILTRAVGLIEDPFVAEDILAEGKADIIALGRAFLADPRWAWRAAAALGEPLRPIAQYHRAAPLIAQWAPKRQKVKQSA